MFHYECATSAKLLIIVSRGRKLVNGANSEMGPSFDGSSTQTDATLTVRDAGGNGAASS
jgi:hypothetical protein